MQPLGGNVTLDLQKPLAGMVAKPFVIAHIFRHHIGRGLPTMLAHLEQIGILSAGPCQEASLNPAHSAPARGATDGGQTHHRPASEALHECLSDQPANHRCRHGRYATPAAFAARLEKQRAGLNRPLLHPRYCATTTAALSLPLDERRGHVRRPFVAVGARRVDRLDLHRRVALVSRGRC